ncbi:MAG TPA: nitroreductase family protein [Nitrospiria bacterium]|nr:nitroreductase family protein [Nitrospiria bacterium]
MIKKKAETKFTIHSIIAERWSPRVFDPARPVEENKINALMEAARWAPSSNNEQPWSFILFNEKIPSLLDQARECLSRGNSWAKKAPLLILSVARTHFSENGTENRHAFHDVGLATENLLLQSFHLGLISHPMAGFDVHKSVQVFTIPENNIPVAMIAVGYPGDLDTIPTELKDRELAPRNRKGFSEFVFNGMWGKSE